MDNFDSVKNVNETVASKNKIENIAYYIFLFIISISPIVFFSKSFSPIDLIKYDLITYGILVSVIIYLISVFKDKTISIPKNNFISSTLLIVVSTILSTLFSSNIGKSFIGQGFESSTTTFILILIISSLLCYNFIKNSSERVLHIYSGILISFICLVLFQLIRMVTGPDFMSFGIFKTLSSTPIGKFSDLGIFSSIILLISFFAYKILNLSKSNKIISLILIALSSIVLLFVNFPLVFTSVIMVLILIIIDEFYKSYSSSKNIVKSFYKISVVPVILLILFSLFLFKGDIILSKVVGKLDISNSELYLPWQYTLDIGADTIKSSPILGAGPNKFTSQYLKYKPQEINSTQFYNVDFNNGFGNIPSILVTQGLLGAIAWIIFLCVFLNSGYKNIIKKDSSRDFAYFTKISVFCISLILIIFNIIYTPFHVIMFLTAIFVGIYVSTITTKDYVLDKKYLKIILLIAIVVLVSWFGFLVKKGIALSYFNQGIKNINLPNNAGVKEAKDKFKKALSFDEADIYYQALTENNIIQISLLVSELQKISNGADRAKSDEITKEISKLVEEALQYSRKAIEIDNTNYYNYISEARISEVASGLKVKNAYENTINAYINAIKISPRNPYTYLAIARFEFSNDKIENSLPYIGAALQLKQNYLDAVFLLAQVQVKQGKTKDAIDSVKFATQINPNDPTLFFQLGILYYNDKNYYEAINALNQAIKLNNSYANAQYFLGLSYARVQNIKDAIINFEVLEKTNPESEEVKLILKNLRIGKSIFADATPTIDSKPEKRTTLPLTEKKSTVKKTNLTR